MGLPPVVVGLFISIFLSGAVVRWVFFELIYTPTAMMIAQVVIAFPIVAGLTMASFQALDSRSLLGGSLGHRRLKAAVGSGYSCKRGEAAAALRRSWQGSVVSSPESAPR